MAGAVFFAFRLADEKMLRAAARAPKFLGAQKSVIGRGHGDDGAQRRRGERAAVSAREQCAAVGQRDEGLGQRGAGFGPETLAAAAAHDKRNEIHRR